MEHTANSAIVVIIVIISIIIIIIINPTSVPTIQTASSEDFQKSKTQGVSWTHATCLQETPAGPHTMLGKMKGRSILRHDWSRHGNQTPLAQRARTTKKIKPAKRPQR